MSKPEIDAQALVAALDQRREQEELSWRGLAEELGLSPSTLTRLRNGLLPETSALLSLTRWLGMSVEDFIEDPESVDKGTADLPSQLAPLLRARRDLDEEDVKMLEDIIGAAYRQIQRRRASA